jgi:asparagine synthase (glutamine-hydrolysing)
MCGICGEIVFDGGSASATAIERMADTMAPRGPDGAGVTTRGRIGLGHRRLKIIDLSEAAAQPFVDAATGLTLAFNGCIYNYRALREELRAKGHRFSSAGDTEVIVKAWAEWGPDCVERFHGMFAFAIHERDTGRVALVRDRFGIKPLYLAEGAGRLRFASTPQALLAAGGVDTSIDPVALNHYMSWHAVVPPPRTILRGVRKLPPATIRIVEPDGRTADRVYWTNRFDRTAEDARRPMEEWKVLVLDALRAAVRRRMVADVPVGVLLSGGVDSSLIVGLLSEEGQTGLATYSIGFEAANGETGDEFVYSDLIAERYGTDHRRISVPSSEMLETLPRAVAAMTEPMVSHDAIGFFLLSREVSKTIRVVQSGQGADEVFGGYHWYPHLAGADDPVGAYADAFFDRTHARLATQLAPEHMADRDESLEFVRAHFARPGAEDPVDKALRLDTDVMLVDDPVKRVDSMTMAWGLEARVPFLDHELVELAGRVPSALKLAHGGKGVLKEAARMVVPPEVIDRPKGYFPVPALKHVAGPYLEMCRDALESRDARERGLFRREWLDRLFAAPSDHVTKLRGSELWQAALLEMWLQAQGVRP